MKSFFYKSGALMLAPFVLYALTGIGVSDWGHSGYGILPQIRVYYIEDNELVKMDTLWEQVACPSINTYGTHVAFLRQLEQGAALSVLRIGNDEKKIKDLVKMEEGVERKTRRYIDWGGGDWIYYTPTSKMVDFRRVNVHTGRDEHVLTITGFGPEQEHLCEWRMSADAKLIHMNVEMRHVLKVTGDGVLRRELEWNEGGNAVGSGCTPTISPSGKYITGTYDAGHSRHKVIEVKFDPRELVEVGRSTTIDWEEWKQGSWPAKQGGVFGGACGRSGSSFSCNSDKWICYASGSDGGGRFYSYGANFVAVNWKDSISVCISKYKSTKSGNDRQQVFNLDFWVKEPLDDVLSSFRDDVNETNRSAYCISGLDEGCQTHQIVEFKTGGLSENIASIYQEEGDAVTVVLQKTMKTIINIVDAGGKLLAHYDNEGISHTVVLSPSRGKRILFVSVQAGRCTTVRKIIAY